MRDQHRFLRDIAGIQGRPVAAMGNVDRHADLVHALDNARTVAAQTLILRAGRPAADPVAPIGELRNPLAQTVEAIHIVDGSKMSRVLLADQDSDFARGFGPRQVGWSVDAQKVRLVRGYKGIPSADVAQRSCVDVSCVVPYGGMKNRDSRIFQPLEIGLLKTVWLRLPG